ncbi:MAG TPA: hypothetical protein VM452_11570 [Caulifigura sp.]|nr:hypothetical protein [Caulifigura sp.]
MNRVVESEDSNGCPGHGSEPDNRESIKLKVLGPDVLPWMKETRHDAGFRIDPRQIRALVEVAGNTGEGQIREIVRSTMLPRNDMFDLVADERKFTFRQVTVFTALSGSGANLMPNIDIHELEAA